MVLNFGGVEKFQISDFKNFGFVHMISNGLSDYKAFVRRVDSKHMATKIWVRLEHGWGWHQKKCETNTGGTRAEQWNRFQACPCYRIWKEWAYMNVDDSAIPPLGLKY